MLVPNSPEDVRAQLEGMDPAQRAEVSPDWLALVHSVTTIDPWILGFTVRDAATDAVVGSCGFKGPPGTDATVEIAYGVSPEHEGKGYATEMAAALVTFALESGRVRVVRAHTLSATGASARVLSKNGFRRIGDVVDPEDGLVSRWEYNRP